MRHARRLFERMGAWLDRATRLRRGEIDPETLRGVPSWGLSFLLHAFLILLLALLIHIRHRGGPPPPVELGSIDTQLGDVSSLVLSNHSGDPFTDETSADPPSIGLPPLERAPELAGQPEFAALGRYAPSLAGPAPVGKSAIDRASTESLILLPELSATITAPFSGRQGLERAKLVRREGGTAESEKSVEDGLEWLARHQRPDGSWGLNYHDQCQGTGCGGEASVQSDTAATGLALLPFLGAGYIHSAKSRHQVTVRKGIEWLVAHQQPDGDAYVGGQAQPHLYSHAIATMALCESYGLSQDPKLKHPAQRAVTFVIRSQDPSGGGWRYAPGQPGDVSVFGWHIFALRSANMAGFKPPKQVLKLCSRFLDQTAADRSRTTYSYMPGSRPTAVMTAEALVARQLLGWPRDFPALVKGASVIARDLETSEERNIYYWYYGTQLLHNMKKKEWERWNKRVREGLIAAQIHDDSCARGSWDPNLPVPDRWSSSGGRLFLTSLSLLTLEVYYRYLPIYRDYDEQQANPDRDMKVDDRKDDSETKKDDAP